jgi:predicted dehydrogenase
MPASGKVKVGVIGSQFQADIHLASIQQMGEEAEVVAVASPTPGMKTIASFWPSPTSRWSRLQRPITCIAS